MLHIQVGILLFVFSLVLAANLAKECMDKYWTSGPSCGLTHMLRGWINWPNQYELRLILSRDLDV